MLAQILMVSFISLINVAAIWLPTFILYNPYYNRRNFIEIIKQAFNKEGSLNWVEIRSVLFHLELSNLLSCQIIFETLTYLIINDFIRFGSKLFRQNVSFCFVQYLYTNYTNVNLFSDTVMFSFFLNNAPGKASHDFAYVQYLVYSIAI